MKLATNASTIKKLLKELLLEYKLQEENPFAAANDEKSGDEESAADEDGEGEAEGDEKDDEKKKPAASDKALTIKFDPSAVKRYNANKDWRAGEAEVKNISKKGIEVDVDGTSVLVNFDDITERAHQFFKKKTKLQEEATKLDAEDEKQIADLEREMGAVANQLGSDFSAASSEIKQQVQDMPEEELNERKQKLNEAIGATAIIGFILALPKLVEILTKSMAKLIKLIQKFTKANPPETEEEKVEWAEKIIEFTHKWHKLYIKAFYYMFKMSGLYKKAGITDESTKMKVAKIFYYTVVAGLAVAAGIGAVGAFKTAAAQASHGGEFAIGTFESVMASIKSGEVAEFLGELGLSASKVS